jgi:hypothetical protein
MSNDGDRIWFILNNALEKMWLEAAVAWYKVLPRRLTGGKNPR